MATEKVLRLGFDTAGMVAGARAARTELSGVKQAAREVANESVRLESLLSQVKTQTKGVASESERLAASLSKEAGTLRTVKTEGQGTATALDQVQQSSRKVNTEVEKSASLFQKLGVQTLSLNRVLGALGVTLGVAGVVRGLQLSTTAFLDFDAAMTRSLSIISDVSDEMRAGMVDTAREVSEEINVTATKAAEAYFFLASAGFTVEQSIKNLPIVARFAKAGMFDLATATTLAADAQSALGLKVQDAQQNMVNLTRVTDVLSKANILSNAEIRDFSEALTNEAAAAMRSFGIEVEEGVAVLAAFADQGNKGLTAGTDLSRILRLVTNAAVKNKEAMAAMGVEVFDQTGNLNNLADVVEDITVALQDLSDEERVAALETLGFEARIQGVILPLLGTQDAIRKYEEALRSAGGATQEIVDKQMEGLREQIGQILQAFRNWRAEQMEKLVPALKHVIDNIHLYVDAMQAAVAVTIAYGAIKIGTTILNTVKAWVAQAAATRAATLATEQKLAADVAATQAELLAARAAFSHGVTLVDEAAAANGAAIATARLANAERAAAAATEAATVAAAAKVGIGARLLGLFAGPGGLIAVLAAATFAWMAYSHAQRQAKEEADEVLRKQEELRQSFAFMSREQLESAVSAAQAAKERNEALLTELKTSRDALQKQAELIPNWDPRNKAVEEELEKVEARVATVTDRVNDLGMRARFASGALAEAIEREEAFKKGTEGSGGGGGGAVAMAVQITNENFGRALKAVEELKESVKDAEFAKQFETDAEKAEELATQLEQDRTKLKALEAGIESYTRRWFEANKSIDVAKRTLADFYRTAVSANGGLSAQGTFTGDPKFMDQSVPLPKPWDLSTPALRKQPGADLAAQMSKELEVAREYLRVLDEGEEAVKAFTREQDVQTRMAKLVEAGYKGDGAALRQMAENLVDAGRAAEEMEEDLRKTLDTIDNIRDAADTVINLAHSFDVLNDKQAAVAKQAVETGAAISKVVATGGSDPTAWIQAIASTGSLIKSLFGGEDAAEQKRIIEHNTRAMQDLRDSIDSWGDKVRDLSASQIGEFTQFAEFSKFMQTQSLPEGVGLKPTGTAGDLTEFLGFDFGEVIDQAEWQQLLDAWDEFFEEAKRQVNEGLQREMEIRRLALSGDTDQIARLEADADQQEKVAEATALYNQQLIDQATYLELLKLAGDEYNATVEEINRLAAERQEAARREIEAVENDLNLRLMVAQGMDEEAEARRLQLEQQEEVRALTEQYGIAMGELAAKVHEAENAARAAAEAEAQLAAQRAFESDTAIRWAQARGDAEEVARLRAQDRYDSELERVTALFQAGTITQAQLDDFIQLIGVEFSNALITAGEAAEVAAAKMAQAAVAMEQDLQLRALNAQGFTNEAQTLRQQFSQESELAKAIADGMSDELVTELKRVQGLERDALAQQQAKAAQQEAMSSALDMAQEVKEKEKEKRKPTNPMQGEIVRSVAGVSEVTALRLTDIALIDLQTQKEHTALLRDIAMSLRGSRLGSPAAGSPTIPGTTSVAPAASTGPARTFNFNAPITVVANNPQEFADRLGRVDTPDGDPMAQEWLHTGDLKLR